MRDFFLLRPARLCLGLTLLFGVQGCVQDIEMVGGFDQIEPKSLLGNQDVVAFDVAFYNPNFFKMQLLDVQLDVLAGGTGLGQIRLTDSTAVQLTKKDTTTVSFTFERAEKALGGMMQKGLKSMLNQEPIVVEVSGEVVGKAMGKTKVVEVAETDTVDIALPKLQNRRGRSGKRW